MAAVARPRVRLVVTADDFGYCPLRDEGIVEAFLAGTVTSVSLLVNGAAAESAAELARRCWAGLCPGPGWGLEGGRRLGPTSRTGLTSMRPSSGTASPRVSTPTCPRAAPWVPPATAPRRCSVATASFSARWDSGRRWRPGTWLCPRCGCSPCPPSPAPQGLAPRVPRAGARRCTLPPFELRRALTRSRKETRCSRHLSFQVREELEAQLSRFRELLGRAPTHVDGHQHVHVLPGVCQVFAEALQASGVRFTRLPLELGVGGCAWLEAPARAFACTVERDARAAVGPFSRHGLRWTDAFVGLSTCGRHMSAHRLLGALARALEGRPAGHALTAELMAHPGYPSVPPAGGCGEGPDAFSCSWERLHELRVLTAPTLRAQLAQDGVQLCALDDLDSKRPGEGVPCGATLEPFLQPSTP
uniref:Carbohydrate deacetylase n=1 Tax=Oryctolagus cuniculus TaxID=9986 RepID=A0A5F9D0H3_RABIT